MSLTNKLTALEVENKQLKKGTEDLKSLVSRLEARVDKLEIGGGSPAKPAAAPAPAPAPAEEEEDDDCDLFGSDEDEEDSEEKQKIVAERLKAYAERKAKKPGPIAKTNVLLDVKPWDDETDMDAMLKEIKTIAKDGFVWGANKLVPVGYGINKLQVMCVVEETMRTAGINEVLYFAYDFNRQCDMRNWENLDTLLDEQQLHQYQEQYGYHLQSREGEYLARQTGVFRTNCIDSLDRTNVAQSLIARRNLEQYGYHLQSKEGEYLA